MEIGCEDGRWTELAQDCVQWWAFVLAVSNRCVLLPQHLLLEDVLKCLKPKKDQLPRLLS